jgi:hypothetical protein
VSYLVYFEGGPLDGQETAVAELRSEHIIQMAAGEPTGRFVSKEMAEDSFIQIETASYLREYAEHREGCVTYFWTEEDRQRAFFEDTDDPDARREAQLAGYDYATERVQQGHPRGARFR